MKSIIGFNGTPHGVWFLGLTGDNKLARTDRRAAAYTFASKKAARDFIKANKDGLFKNFWPFVEAK